MANKIEILTLSKNIDNELYKTISSVIKSARNLNKFQLQSITYYIIIKNYSISNKSIIISDLLNNSDLNFKIIPQDSISDIKHKKFKTNGWYEGVYDALSIVNPNSYLWFLNAGDYALESSLRKILINLKKINDKDLVGLSFLTKIIDNDFSFLKPDIYFEKESNIYILSMLPCFQAVLIKAKFLNDFKELIYKGIEGIEMEIMGNYFKQNLFCFIPECIAIFSYGGTSTTQDIGTKKRLLNIYNFLMYKRTIKLISEIFKFIINILKISFIKRYFIFITRFRSLVTIKVFPFFKKLKLEFLYIKVDSI
mgnify:CR=1 FL=1